jgi:hypothetical protein
MTEAGIELTGGSVFAYTDWTVAFAQGIENLARRLLG